MLLGIDPATYCGFACENGIVGTWHLKKKIKDQVQHPLLRVEHVLERAIREWKVDRIACEDAAAGSWKRDGESFGGNTKTAAFHNQVLGVIKLVAARHSLPLMVLNPATIKAFATKKPYAKKALMRQYLRLHHGTEYEIDKLDDNAVDAIWILKYALANPYGPPKRKKKRKGKGPRKPRKPKEQPLLLPF